MSGPEGIEDIRRRPDSELSIRDGFNEVRPPAAVLGRYAELDSSSKVIADGTGHGNRSQ